MKILLSSHAFAPSIGGIETVSGLLAEEFLRMNHQVKVVTQTADEEGEKFPFPVVRRPSVRKLFSLINWSDVFWQNNLSLRTLWPAFVLGKPVVITHQGSYCVRPAALDLALRLKRAIANRTTSVAISRFVASFFKTRSIILPNPYDARRFTNHSTVAERPGDLVFVGRLVSEKGLDVLLESLGCLRSEGLHPSLTVVGSGPEEMPMQELAKQLEIQNQVRFVGPKPAAEVAEILNQHRVLVVPSRYAEPFGVVALEGIACGCAVVGSGGGGLPEAIGRCGITFLNGNAEALAEALTKLLNDPDECRRLATHAPEHLAQFHPTTIANAYLNLFESKLQ
jgi:glycogen(starch) synthase